MCWVCGRSNKYLNINRYRPSLFLELMQFIIGKVHQGYMVDLQCTNEKLRRRADRILVKLNIYIFLIFLLEVPILSILLDYCCLSGTTHKHEYWRLSESITSTWLQLKSCSKFVGDKKQFFGSRSKQCRGNFFTFMNKRRLLPLRMTIRNRH